MECSESWTWGLRQVRKPDEAADQGNSVAEGRHVGARKDHEQAIHQPEHLLSPCDSVALTPAYGRLTRNREDFHLPKTFMYKTFQQMNTSRLPTERLAKAGYLCPPKLIYEHAATPIRQAIDTPPQSDAT